MQRLLDNARTDSTTANDEVVPGGHLIVDGDFNSQHHTLHPTEQLLLVNRVQIRVKAFIEGVTRIVLIRVPSRLIFTEMQRKAAHDG
jgi:hypothetical protein